MIETFFSTLGTIILVAFKVALFLLISIFVVPAMIVMSFLHGPWEKMLNSVFTLDHF